jgi:hypothetical protein
VEVLAILIGLAVGVGAVMTILKFRRAAGTTSGVFNARRPNRSRIDAFAVGEPWRNHLAAALSAQRRFTGIVVGLDDGPLRARMAEIGRQVDRGVDECWQIAKRGDQLDGTIRGLDGPTLKSNLDRSKDDDQRTSLRSQLDSLDRVRAARNQTDERLRTLQTKLGELVSQAAEVSTGVDHTAELGSAVDEVVIQLEALNEAVDEVNNTGRSRAFEQNGPGASASAT